MATGKYGSASVLFLVDGFSLIANKLKSLRYKHEALTEATHGLGDSWEEHTPTGLSKIELVQEGAFFDTALNRIHTAMSSAPPTTPQASQRVVCVGFAGQTVGESFIGFEGAYTESYEVLGQLGQLTKANATHKITGQRDLGIILQELATKTYDWAGTTYDGGAASTDGGIGYLHVTSSFGTFTGVIQHSDDDSSWTTLLSFTAVAAAPAAERKTVTGSVKRYLRFAGTVWGDVSPSASVSPSSSLSPSTSLSPSVSASISASASTSPSSSLSPSVSASLSASESISPSTSLSPSVSASISASASVSPSTSISPSVSASTSASPSAEAGVSGSVTVFAGFVRS